MRILKTAMLFLLAAALLLPLAACGEKTPGESTAPTADGTAGTDAPDGGEDTGRRLIVNGETFLSVAVQTGKSMPERYAGEELAKYLKKLGIPEGDGLTFDVRLDPELPEEGYAIRPGDGEITICGGGYRGVIYGVYGFLKHYAGARFFAPGIETLGEGDIVVNEDCALTPVFEHRRCDWKMFKFDTDWCVKNGINDPTDVTIPDKKGGCVGYSYGLSPRYIYNIDPAEQPCFSDPEMLEKVIASVRYHLSQRPGIKTFLLAQQDNDNYCRCDKCLAVLEEEGSLSGAIIRFMNAVAEDIAEDYPDVRIEMQAYWWSHKAPKVTKPRDNVIIRLCTDGYCRSHALYDPDCEKNASFINELLEWTAISDNVYIWDYTVNFSRSIPPFPNFGVLWKNMRFFAEHGIRGMFPQGNSTSERYGEFGELRAYLLAQLMMDPTMSEEEYYDLMDEFLEAYYGEGWRNIRAFIDWSCGEASKTHMGCYEPSFGVISEETYLAMEKTIDDWWDEAEALAGDRQEYVHRSRTQWEYIKLMLHPDPEKGGELIQYLAQEKIWWSEYNGDWSRVIGDLEESAPSLPYAYAFRTHESEPTPEGEDSVARLLGEERVIAYLPFDGSSKLGAGSVTTTPNGNLAFEDGYFGQAARFDEGYVTLDGWEPGTNSFSVAWWMKTDGVEEDPCVFSNKDWGSGNFIGFVFSLRKNDMKFNTSNGPLRMDGEHLLPTDYKGGWVYVVFVVDREAGEVRQSYDFGPFEKAAFPAGLKDLSLDTTYDVNIGQDGRGSYGLPLTAALDEFLLVDGVLTEEDLAALKAHYDI